VSDVACASPDLVFLAAGVAVYRSQDGGATWAETLVIKRGMQSVAVSPGFACDGTVFAVDGAGRLFRSTDGGETWEEIARVAHIGGASDARVFLSISPVFPSDPTLWAAAEGTAYRSIDAGLSWEPVDPGQPLVGDVRLVPNPNYPAHPGLEVVSAPLVDPLLLPPDLAYPATAFAACGPTLWLGTTHGLFRSTDGGQTWAEANAGLPRTALGLSAIGADGAYYGLCAGRLYRLSLGGAGWELLSRLPEADFGGGTVMVRDMAVVTTPDGPGVVALTTYDGLFVSLDGGRSWERMEAEGLPPVMFKYPLPLLSSDFAQSGVAHLAYGGDLYRTQDGGHSWAEVDGVPRLESLAETPDGRLIGLTWSAVYEWDPALGEDWVRRASALFHGAPKVVRYVNDRLAVAVADEDFYLSQDGGRSWLHIGRSELEGARDCTISPGFDTDRAVYAVGPDTLYVSTDAGTTWVEAGAGLPACELYGGPECDLDLVGAQAFDAGYRLYATVRHNFQSRAWAAWAEANR
jgi:photosystem II stability/assembly factor-like uncharacterized protein